jgi:hypothetical protein
MLQELFSVLAEAKSPEELRLAEPKAPGKPMDSFIEWVKL